MKRPEQAATARGGYTGLTFTAMVTTEDRLEQMADTAPSVTKGRRFRRQPERRRWRDWLIPRTVLGMVVLILALAVGMAASGVAFYAYYEYKTDTSEDRVNNYIKGFDGNYDTARKTIDAEKNNAVAEVEKALEPLRQTQAGGGQLSSLVTKVAPSLFFVETLDEAGQPSVGSAFAVANDGDQTLLVASYLTIKASTRRPAPDISVRQGEEKIKATLHTWHEDRDLALLMIDKKDVPKLEFAPREPPLQTGVQLFAVSGLGSAGGSITQGFVADVSASGIQHNAAIGPHFQGGPMINAKAQVVGVASRGYSPLGFRADAVYFSPPIRAACERILRCPSDNQINAGSKS